LRVKDQVTTARTPRSWPVCWTPRGGRQASYHPKRNLDGPHPGGARERILAGTVERVARVADSQQQAEHSEQFERDAMPFVDQLYGARCG